MDRHGSLALSSRSTSKSPLASPTDEQEDPIVRNASNLVAFVPFDIASSSGVSSATRRAVRSQAARASAATRKRTIAKKLAEQRGLSYDESSSSSSVAAAAETERGRRLSVPASITARRTSELTASPSPARSVSGGQFGPFRPYPVSSWHPQIPAFVDHFLKYFSPDTTMDIRGREAMRLELWTDALDDKALFHALLLTVATHALVSRAQTVSSRLLAQFKRTALENINDAIARSEVTGSISDSTIGAIALLGGWELLIAHELYGNTDTYDTHMRGLSTIVQLRGGLYGTQSPQSGYTPLSPAVVVLVLSSGHDLALSASRPPYFEHHPYQECDAARALFCKPTPGLHDLGTQRLVLPSLLHMIASLSSITPQDRAAYERLEHIQQRLHGWRYTDIIRASYRPTQTLLDEAIMGQASILLRLGGLVTCAFLRRLVLGENLDSYLQNLYGETLQIQIELLTHTVYEKAAFWALFMICSTSGRCEARHMRILKRIQLEQGWEDWQAAKSVLETFVFPAAILEARAYNLWHAVSSSTIARESNAGTREPTVFAKGIQHPTSWVGNTIAAEER